MDDLDAIRLIYFEECDELLLELDTSLKLMAANGHDPETINAIFRAVHSIKGGAGAFGLERLVRFAHRVESVLEDLRSGRFTPDAGTCDLLFVVGDRLADLVEQAKSGIETAGGTEMSVAEQLENHVHRSATIATHIPAAADPAAAPATTAPVVEDDPFDLLAGLDFTPVPAAFNTPAAHADQALRLSLTPTTALYACGDDVRNALSALAGLGPCRTRVQTDNLPDIDTLDPHVAYLGWTVVIDGPIEENTVREALEWSLDDLGLTFGPGTDNTGDDEPAIPAPATVQPVAAGLAGALHRPTSVDMPVTDAPTPVATSVKQTSIRVDLARVDKLVDLVGELVINQAALQQCLNHISRQQSAGAVASLANLDHLTRELQDGVMAMRAHPIGTVFQRMGRVVREAASATGKPVRLTLSGDHIEVDRSIVEHLVDPLTHILRNAVDHGIETPDGRLAARKPPEGEIRLTARHRSDRLVVEISDDGRGIDLDRVRAKAIERGLIDANTTLDQTQTLNLIFAPGFSTAATVSDLSGRGVGMDVVKRSVSELGGRISVQSEYGRGTDIVLSLPLTLAVLDGMIFKAGGQTFIAPVSNVVESLTPDPARIFSLSDGSLIYSGRGMHLPVIDVGYCLTSTPCIHDRHVPLVMIVDTEGGQRLALAVDTIVQQAQVVIKSIEKNYARIEGIAAATILGNGDVALIVDVDALLDRASPAGIPRTPISACF